MQFQTMGSVFGFPARAFKEEEVGRGGAV